MMKTLIGNVRRSDEARTRPARGPRPPCPANRLCRQGDAEDQTGAVLILALIFLVAVSLTILSLFSWLGTSLDRRRLQERAITGERRDQRCQPGYPVHPHQLRQSVRQRKPAGCLLVLWSERRRRAQQPPPIDSNPNDVVSVWCSMVWQPSSPRHTSSPTPPVSRA